jgi:hypothetical protein
MTPGGRARPDRPQRGGAAAAPEGRAARAPLEAAVLALQRTAGNRAVGALVARGAGGPAGALLQRRALTPDEELEAAELSARYDDRIASAYHANVIRKRDDLVANAVGAAFDTVLKPHVTSQFVARMRDFFHDMVAGQTSVFRGAGREAEKAIQANLERLKAGPSGGGTATAKYAEMQLLATSRGSRWDKGLLLSDVRNQIQQAAADLGIERAALKLPQVTAALEEAHEVLRSSTELFAKTRSWEGRDVLSNRQSGLGLSLAMKLDVYNRSQGSARDEAGDAIVAQMGTMRSGIGADALSAILGEVVADVARAAEAKAETLKASTLARLNEAFDGGAISREGFSASAGVEASSALRDAKTAERLGSDAVRVASEGAVHTALANAAPIIDLLASRPDTSTTVTINVDVPIKGAVVGFEFKCKVAKDTAGVLSIESEAGVSAGIGIASVLKAALGGGVYVDAKSPAGAVALMDSVSLAFYRRFHDLGVPYTDHIWGLGGKTAERGESEDEARAREARAFAAMVEEQMGEKGEVETGAYGRGTLAADAGLLSGGLSLTGRTGTLLDKRAFAETKERKASTGGFIVALSAAVGPLKGTVTGTIRNVSYDTATETSGSFAATLTGQVPGTAIFGNPLQAGTRVATWIAELAAKVKLMKERIEEIRKTRSEESPIGDAKLVYGLEEQLREAGELAKAGITGEWSEKAREMTEESAKSLTTSMSGVTLGFKYAVDAKGAGTGTVYLDLASTTSITLGVAKASYAAGERLWSKKFGG